jgi:hypothetical protein
MDNDDVLITIGDITISTDGMQTYDINNNWIDITDTIDLDNLTITLNDPVEFEDHMPDVAKIEDMCRDYPALEKAYENFKTIYKMVHQDWQGRQDDEPPF